MKRRASEKFALMLLLLLPLWGAAVPPVRVAPVIDGHVHPGIAVARSGAVLVAFNRQHIGGKELLLSRSTDGGKTWSAATAIVQTDTNNIYPGSLTTLRGGSVVANWSQYYPEGRSRRGSDDYRTPYYALSRDEGITWSAPSSYPLQNLTYHSCLRHSVLELPTGSWVLLLYDRTVMFDPVERTVEPLGDGRRWGMAPMVRTHRGTLLTGDDSREGGGFRSMDSGKTWQPLNAFPRLRVAGYDLTVLQNGRVLLSMVDYDAAGVEIGLRLVVSDDDGMTWDFGNSISIYAPQRRIKGRGWPRTVQLDERTVGTVYFDLEGKQPGGAGVYFIRTAIDALKPKRITPR